MEIVIGLLALLVVFVVAEKAYNVFSWGFVFFKFWYWFLLPVFVTLPEIGYLQAVGLMFILTFFKSSTAGLTIKDEYIDKKKKTITRFIVYLLPWISLGLGYLFNLIIN